MGSGGRPCRRRQHKNRREVYCHKLLFQPDWAPGLPYSSHPGPLCRDPSQRRWPGRLPGMKGEVGWWVQLAQADSVRAAPSGAHRRTGVDHAEPRQVGGRPRHPQPPTSGMPTGPAAGVSAMFQCLTPRCRRHHAALPLRPLSLRSGSAPLERQMRPWAPWAPWAPWDVWGGDPSPFSPPGKTRVHFGTWQQIANSSEPLQVLLPHRAPPPDAAGHPRRRVAVG